MINNTTEIRISKLSYFKFYIASITSNILSHEN